MRAARFRVDAELLRQLLHMPPASLILDARVEFPAVELVVHNPSLPEADEPHACEPIVTRPVATFRAGMQTVRVGEPVWDWNLPTDGDTDA